VLKEQLLRKVVLQFRVICSLNLKTLFEVDTGAADCVRQRHSSDLEIVLSFLSESSPTVHLHANTCFDGGSEAVPFESIQRIDFL
jgi:hypothetical protein